MEKYFNLQYWWEIIGPGILGLLTLFLVILLIKIFIIDVLVDFFINKIDSHRMKSKKWKYDDVAKRWGKIKEEKH